MSIRLIVAASFLMVAAANAADVGVTMLGPSGEFVNAGTNATYTITVTNYGAGDAQMLTLSDATPPGSTFVSFAAPAEWTCTMPAPGATGTVVCSTPSLAVGVIPNFTLTVLVHPNLFTEGMINTASIRAAGDGNSANNSATTVTPIGHFIRLTMTESGPDMVTAGGTITQTIVTTNEGPSGTNVPSLTGHLSPDTTLTSLLLSPGWTCHHFPDSGGEYFGCSFLDGLSETSSYWPPRTSFTFTLTLRVSPAAPNGSTITNSFVTNAPTPGWANAESSAVVSTSADVSIAQSGSANTSPFSKMTYTLEVVNAGLSDAQAVTLTDAVPAGTTFVSFVQQSGPPFSCVTPAVGGNGVVSCTIPVLASGATSTFAMVVAAGAAGPVSNPANVSSETTDPNSTNNSANLVTTFVDDLSIVTTAGSAALLPGNDQTYTLTVSNAGLASASGVTVTDVLPSTLTLVSATPVQGTCSGTTTVTCSLGTLTAGSTAAIVLVVKAGNTLGTVSNAASVASSNADASPANNISSVSFNIVAAIPALSPFVLLLTGLALGIGGVLAARADL